jgi:hypothetical protein
MGEAGFDRVGEVGEPRDRLVKQSGRDVGGSFDGDEGDSGLSDGIQEQ